MNGASDAQKIVRVMVRADPTQLEQVIMNLVINARDAIETNGDITIEIGRVEFDAETGRLHANALPGLYAMIAVTDTGRGMSSATQERIFEPFFTTKEVGKGSGLGLATVYGIVAQLEGWIEVASAVNHGTTLSIFLPVSEEKAEPVRSTNATDLRGGDETILVVEDEPAVREIMTQVLRHHGYDVIEAGDGREAIGMWSERGR